ncbi:MAG TPA: Ldh family oxidoreductase [Thermomicrobiales bacterium]|nr:Ldh family oxidoreductase [Thermomicrobiales bacterium]
MAELGTIASPPVVESDPRFPREMLVAFTATVLAKLDLAEDLTTPAAEHLVLADERGVASHGLARLPYYAKRFRTGLIDARAGLTVIRETPSSLVLDANNGFGFVLGPQAMDRCIKQAESSGVCIATVRHSNHFGIAGAYALMAVPHGMIGVAMTNASPLVVPTFGTEARLGTNPFAVAVPTGPGPDDPPLVLDMSTSTVAWGKIEIARRANKLIPMGWAVDEHGQPTTDPHAARWLTSLGGSPETSGHKGYGLGVLVDVLCGPLAGAAWSARISGTRGPAQPSNIGHVFMAWRVDAFREPAEFYADLAGMIDSLRSTPAHPDHTDTGVLAPGDPEHLAAERSRQEGVPVAVPVIAELEQLASELDIPFPLRAGSL